MTRKKSPDDYDPEIDRAIAFVERWMKAHPDLPAKAFQVRYLRLRNDLTIDDMAKVMGMSKNDWLKFERGENYYDSLADKALNKLAHIDGDFRTMLRRQRMAYAGVHLPMTEEEV